MAKSKNGRIRKRRKKAEFSVDKITGEKLKELAKAKKEDLEEAVYVLGRALFLFSRKRSEDGSCEFSEAAQFIEMAGGRTSARSIAFMSLAKASGISSNQ